MLALATAYCAKDARAVNCLGTAPVTELGTVVNPRPAAVLSKSNRLVRLAPGGNDIRYLRPHITVSGQANNTRWTLAIHDSEMRVLQTFSDLDFKGRRHAWAAPIPHQELFVTLSDLENADSISVSIDSLLVVTEKPNNPFYSVQGDDPDNATWRALFGNNVGFTHRRLGESVGMLVIATHPRPLACTGVAVARDLILTNWHCAPTWIATTAGVVEVPEQFWTDEHCSNTIVDFSWDDDSVSRDFSCTEVVEKDEYLDYALLRIAPDGRDRAVRIARLRSTPRAEDGSLTLVHHPLADRKQITVDCQFGQRKARNSWRGNRLQTEFEHICDSEAGSSGAPIFDSEGFVIGLHHLGFDRHKHTCMPIDSVNKAVWIDAIIEDLREKNFSIRDLGIVLDQH